MKEKNEKKCIRSGIVLLLFFVFLITLTVIDSKAGELRDYKLPSQMSQQFDNRSFDWATTKSKMSSQFDSQSLEQTQTPIKSSSELSIDVYEKFRQDVKKLTRQKRTELKVGFEEKAKNTTNQIEKTYYSRLIAILTELGIN